jgi:hypothetical protein
VLKIRQQEEIDMAKVVRQTTSRFARWISDFRKSRYYDNIE